MSMVVGRQPGDIVNQVYSQCIDPLIQMCTDVGDNPTVLIEQVKDELRVNGFFLIVVSKEREESRNDE